MVQITLKTPDGVQHERTIDSDEFSSLESAASSLSGLPANGMRLVLKGKIVKPNKPLSEQGIVDGAVVHVMRKPGAPAPGPAPAPAPAQPQAPPSDSASGDAQTMNSQQQAGAPLQGMPMQINIPGMPANAQVFVQHSAMPLPGQPPQVGQPMPIHLNMNIQEPPAPDNLSWARFCSRTVDHLLSSPDTLPNPPPTPPHPADRLATVAPLEVSEMLVTLNRQLGELLNSTQRTLASAGTEGTSNPAEQRRRFVLGQTMMALASGLQNCAVLLRDSQPNSFRPGGVVPGLELELPRSMVGSNVELPRYPRWSAGSNQNSQSASVQQNGQNPPQPAPNNANNPAGNQGETPVPPPAGGVQLPGMLANVATELTRALNPAMQGIQGAINGGLAAAGAAGSNSVTPQEMQSIRNQLQSLETRVRSLEQAAPQHQQSAGPSGTSSSAVAGNQATPNAASANSTAVPQPFSRSEEPASSSMVEEALHRAFTQHVDLPSSFRSPMSDESSRQSILQAAEALRTSMEADRS